MLNAYDKRRWSMTKPEPQPQTRVRTNRWFPTLLIGWNLLDVLVHVAVDMVEPWRVAGNVVGMAAALVVVFGAKVYAPHVLAGAAGLVVVVNAIHSTLNGWVAPSLVFIGVSLLLLLLWTQDILRKSASNGEIGAAPVSVRRWAALGVTLVGLVAIALVGEQEDLAIGPLTQLHDGALVAADYWADDPSILSAGLGFDNIIGLPELTEETVREAGGSWFDSLACTNGEEPADTARTSASTSDAIALVFKGFSDYGDGLPIVFSWPVATETVDLTDFRFTLNTGETVFPSSIGMWPNWELNERNTVVAVGDFGNRGLSSEGDAVFPVRLDIVEDDTPLLLIGPGGQQFNAVGLSWETDKTPYDSGPVLVGAKLNRVGEEALGEGGVRVAEGLIGFPNDEFALYDGGDFRIRRADDRRLLARRRDRFTPRHVRGLLPGARQWPRRRDGSPRRGRRGLRGRGGHPARGRPVGPGAKEDPTRVSSTTTATPKTATTTSTSSWSATRTAARNVTFVEIPSLEGWLPRLLQPRRTRPRTGRGRPLHRSWPALISSR
jgi:hypothetical protein